MSSNELLNIIVILGPTASGKTKLGVQLAANFNGEIVSADSRQVYCGMDIGTGKDLKEYEANNKKIKHHLIDVVNPKDDFNLSKYQKLAYTSINDIIKRNKLPIIVGGSGLYLQAIVDGYNLSAESPLQEERFELEKLSVNDLYLILKKLKSGFAEKLNNSDKNNKRRLIRYIELLKNPEKKEKPKQKKFNSLLIGLKPQKEEMHAKIKKRLKDRLEKENMIGEIEYLLNSGITHKKLENFGLEYKYISFYLKGILDYEEMEAQLFIAIKKFAKKQRTWFARWERQGTQINWVLSYNESKILVNNFLKKQGIV